MTRLLLILACVLCVSFQSIRAQTFIALNPGVKAGWTFGQGGGFVYGVELSLTVLDVSRFNRDAGMGAGVVLAFLIKNGESITQLALEAMWYGAGLQIGPVFVHGKDGQTHSGMAVEGFAGAVFMAHAGRVFMFDRPDWWQGGVYLKAPIALSGSYSLVNPFE